MKAFFVRAILRAIPTCTLWALDFQPMFWYFRPWPSIRVPQFAIVFPDEFIRRGYKQ